MTAPGITLEPADADDLTGLRTIQHAVLAEPSPALLDAAVNGIATALVARFDRPVGYLLMLTADDAAYVPELAVESDCQRQGIGTALLEAAADRARTDGATELRLTVRLEDDDASAFYRAQGFDVLERLPEHYDTGTGTGLLLTRPL